MAAAAAKNKQTTIVSDGADSDFTQTDLQKYWAEFADNLPPDKVHLKNTLLACQPTLNDNYAFSVTVFNHVQKDEIAEQETAIIAFLSDRLKNSQLKLTIEVAEKDDTQMLYTAEEKYKHLVSKNELVEKLRAAFNLAID